MKLTPASAAESAMRFAVASSVRSPNIIVPRQSSDTFSPLLPSRRYSMVVSFECRLNDIQRQGAIINDCGLLPRGAAPELATFFCAAKRQVAKEKAAPVSHA